MSERRTVVEVIATTALEVEIPIDYGDDLGAGVETVLGEIDGVRYAAIEELGDVTAETRRENAPSLTPEDLKADWMSDPSSKS